ncbi:zinc knuckle domain protein [Aspergillus stella-maris]|uniref:zinc knuckle domain protein n=1 Tax=Aspergillus stella-maris TaxID=1810926 RepID=UPI003CCD6348
MPPSPPSEEDSRTATLAAQRTRGTRSGTRSKSGSAHSSRHASREPPSKRQRRGNGKGPRGAEVQDFVPRGASFSKESLEVDPQSEGSRADGNSAGEEEDTSDSGSGSESGSESGNDNESDSESDNEKNGASVTPAGGVSAPAPNWNKTGRGVIRTSLRSRQPATTNANTTTSASATPASEPAADKNFEAVNGKYWRSRSESGSPTPEKEGTAPASATPAADNDFEMEEGEINGDQSAASGSGDSDDSGSLDSEADDSIMLNTIGSRGEIRSQNDIINISDDDDDEDDSEGDGYDPEALPVSRPAAVTDLFSAPNGTRSDSKDSALQRLSKRYPIMPSTLADLDREDLEIQAKIVFYSRDIYDLNLQQPIMCMECLREGHHTEICPLKECVHCGAWNTHQSNLCPKWRRCQRCRERGHDTKQCSSSLKSSASEVPCDLCGSTTHLELDCDFLWKLPRQDTTAAPCLVSISCAHCTSNKHLIGDCPSLARPFLSSNFTIRGIDPNLITDISNVVGARRPGPPPPPSGGLKIRGRAENTYHRFSSPESDDMMPRGGNSKRGGPNRNANRGNINIRIGGGRNNGPPPPSVRDYRDRDDPYRGGYNSRQRSMSPPRDRGRPARGRGGGPPRSPPRRGGRGGGGNGRGNGRAKRDGGGGDAYRPMPSAGKKAWDRYRL